MFHLELNWALEPIKASLLRGITCNNLEYKIGQYADDSNLIIADMNSNIYALNIINK